jgi:hypothetical protein
MVAIIFISISEILLTYSYFYVERCNWVVSTPTSYSEVLSSNLGAVLLSPLRFYVPLSISPGRCQDSGLSSIWPRPLPSTTFLIHHSLIVQYLQRYNNISVESNYSFSFVSTICCHIIFCRWVKLLNKQSKRKYYVKKQTHSCTHMFMHYLQKQKLIYSLMKYPFVLIFCKVFHWKNETSLWR